MIGSKKYRNLTKFSGVEILRKLGIFRSVKVAKQITFWELVACKPAVYKKVSVVVILYLNTV